MNYLYTKNGIATLGDDVVIALKNIATITTSYSPSMFSDGKYHLMINGVSVMSSYKFENIKNIQRDLLRALQDG